MTGTQDIGKSLKYPRPWIGYICGFFAFTLSFALLYLKPDDKTAYTALTGFLSAAMYTFYIIGAVYWFMSVHRLHKIILASAGGLYPISAGQAVGYQFIPFFNLYWMFRWTGEISEYLAHIQGRKVMAKNEPGLALLLASILGRLIMGFTLVIDFAVMDYICKKTKETLESAALPVGNYAKPKYKSSGAMICLWAFLIFLVFLLAAIAVPNFMKARQTALQKARTVQTSVSAQTPVSK